MSRLHLLISAYGCEPKKGSEQGVGWNWCMEIAKFANLTVVTRSNNKIAIEESVPDALKGNISFVYYDLPLWLLRYKNKEKGLYFYYLLWQSGAYFKSKKLINKTKFDYVMQLTFGSIWLPVFMHRLPLPFIWGPIGGGEAVPFNLIRTLPLKGQFLQYLRYLLIKTLPLNPFLINPIKKASIILARTQDTANIIPKSYQDKVHVVLETAMSDELISLSSKSTYELNETKTLRLIFTGRLIPLKNISVALRALAVAKLKGVKLKFEIFGNGPLENHLISYVSQLGLTQDVSFKGVVTQSEVLIALYRSDVYLFPSLKEGGVWSLMEAMTVGLPVICVDTSGMSTITDDDCAIRVKPTSQAQLTEDFAEAIVRLYQSKELRTSLGLAARERIKDHFKWEHKTVLLKRLLLP